MSLLFIDSDLLYKDELALYRQCYIKMSLLFIDSDLLYKDECDLLYKSLLCYIKMSLLRQ